MGIMSNDNGDENIVIFAIVIPLLSNTGLQHLEAIPLYVSPNA